MARRKRKKIKRVITSAVAELPSSLELTKLNSDNSMSITIRTGELLLGTLIMGRGSVQWWPRGHRVNIARKSWREFAAMLDKAM
jgi:hypothetical protein